MDEKVEINRSYETLDDDDDVLSLGRDLFKVGEFKHLVSWKFYGILSSRSDAGTSYRPYVISLMGDLPISEGTLLSGGNINWNTPQEGIYCQILKIGSKGWQKGKLQIEINHNIKSGETQTSIKFCPDEPLEQKSPLDDIRQSEEYKKLLENN